MSREALVRALLAERFGPLVDWEWEAWCRPTRLRRRQVEGGAA